ncbi:hypothetical protein A3F08_02440 [Candidatus Berkelbacteria bacterium RIFCSPHIGHO2_12_FULL_36_9]|uniref:Uncharacterized protein n=1 Tax=Candidatus Berkelbacteria bacterium RIFCSPHIGHO2_12_FULL_36_9 TaxID=1797469 RepID=A0A1F5EED9_9BACT|nr:MAG: hypothetical protein A3F08_02440 [Candidatus Berkelbacteria bacterium RIFCSPHIGHO2_12_FULL_36_9]
MSKNEVKNVKTEVLEALNEVILPVINKMMEDIDTIKSDVGTLKSDVGTLKNEMKELREENEFDHQEMKQRLEKVEFNTRVYPHDKEYVYNKFDNHEKRIGKLELKVR